MEEGLQSGYCCTQEIFCRLLGIEPLSECFSVNLYVIGIFQASEKNQVQ